jgi:hypothetical protein
MFTERVQSATHVHSRTSVGIGTRYMLDKISTLYTAYSDLFFVYVTTLFVAKIMQHLMVG